MDLGYNMSYDQLGVLYTIYEEEEESTIAQRFPSPEFTSSHPLTRFPELTRSTRFPVSGARLLNRTRDRDVVIHVGISCFKLHKEVLVARSGYLKRNLKDLSEITLSPPLNISPETFKLVCEFCYGNFVDMSPYNIGALRIAAELLEMTEISDSGDQNLAQITEAYFRDVILVNSDDVCTVLSSVFLLLPEAETTSSLFSRCIEMLSLIEIDDAVHKSWFEGIQKMDSEKLELLVAPTSKRLTQCHDIIYMMIDLHLEENGEDISEEQKTRLCDYIDCSILSPQLLVHAVQNPRMPVRFVVRAMFIESRKTRQSISYKIDEPRCRPTLGAILERDRALREVEELKDVVTTTNKRIQTLENELSCIKWITNEPRSGHSTSLRLSSKTDRKVNRWQSGSQSSLNFRVMERKVRAREPSSSDESLKRRAEKNYGRKLFSGLKSVFSLQGLSWKKGENRGHS